MRYITLLVVVILGVLGINYFENCESDESRAIKELEGFYKSLCQISKELALSESLESKKLICSAKILVLFEDIRSSITPIDSSTEYREAFEEFENHLAYTKYFFEIVRLSWDPDYYEDIGELENDLEYILERANKCVTQLKSLLTRIKQLNNWLLNN